MSFEKFPLFPKREISTVHEENIDAEIITNVLNKMQSEGIEQSAVQEQPHELNPGQPRHEVHNVPRQLPKPGYAPTTFPDSTVPPKPQATM